MFLRQALAQARAQQTRTSEPGARVTVQHETPFDTFARDLNRAIENLGGEYQGFENDIFSITPAPY